MTLDWIKKLFMLFFSCLIILPVFYAHVLNFQEILRVGLVTVIFFAIYLLDIALPVRRTKNSYMDMVMKEREAWGRIGIVLALVAVFITFQFDPAYSGHGGEAQVSRNNLFFWLNSGMILAMGGLTVYAMYRSLGSAADTVRAVVMNMKVFDRAIPLIALFVVVGGIPVRLALGSHPIGMNYMLTGVKVIGIAVLWIIVRMALTYPLEKGRPEKAEGAAGDRLIGARGIKRLYRLILLVFLLDITQGGWKVGNLYAGYRDLNSLSTAAPEAYVIEKSKELLERNSALRVDWIEQGTLEKMAVAYQKIDSVKQSEAIIKDLQVYLAGNDAANRIKADIYYAAGNNEKAQGEYEQYLQKGFRDAGSVKKLAECYLGFGNMMGLIDLIREYNYAPPKKEYSSEENILIGNALMEAGRLKTAEGFYQNALSSNEDKSYVLYKLGRLKYEESNIPTAMEYFQNAIDEDSSFADAYYRLGLCYEDKGDSIRAYHIYNYTLEILPNHYDAMLKLKKGFIFGDSL